MCKPGGAGAFRGARGARRARAAARGGGVRHGVRRRRNRPPAGAPGGRWLVQASRLAPLWRRSRPSEKKVLFVASGCGGRVCARAGQAGGTSAPAAGRGAAPARPQRGRAAACSGVPRMARRAPHGVAGRRGRRGGLRCARGALAGRARGRKGGPAGAPSMAGQGLEARAVAAAAAPLAAAAAGRAAERVWGLCRERAQGARAAAALAARGRARAGAGASCVGAPRPGAGGCIAVRPPRRRGARGVASACGRAAAGCAGGRLGAWRGRHAVRCGGAPARVEPSSAARAAGRGRRPRGRRRPRRANVARGPGVCTVRARARPARPPFRSNGGTDSLPPLFAGAGSRRARPRGRAPGPAARARPAERARARPGARRSHVKCREGEQGRRRGGGP